MDEVGMGAMKRWGPVLGLLLTACATVDKAPVDRTAAVAVPSPWPEAPRSATQTPGGAVVPDELPEAIQRVAPSYPEAAREKKVQGLVQLEALVGTDGSVLDTRIQKSIPELDQAAIDCVRQWRFKPAQLKGAPVEAWVVIPIRFTLH